MSSFLSPKYLRFRGPAATAPITRDLPCTSCGYNLRGLNYGRNCPECGTLIELTRASSDLLLACSESDRTRWRWGLSLAATVILLAMATQVLWVSSFLFPMGWGSLDWLFFVDLGSVLLWFTAVMLLTPPRLDSLGTWARAVRLAARGLTAPWPIGCLLVSFPSLSPGIHALAGLGILLGVVGSLLVVYLMLHVAWKADLESAERRLERALWLLPPTTLLLAPLPLIPWAVFFPIAIVLIVPLLVLAAWSWAMLITSWSLLEMLNHVRWAEIQRDHGALREQRMADLRATLDGEAQSVVRPLPHAAPEEVRLEE